ncbi:MAG: UDP-N-acetylmuramoyl-L-alanine--D-glutamate ligase [Xanthomonadales bacterium]|nr:UDP-N-acetylmuramoyl-L-alanine--D-glutamate ligase [Xanthomonadales bacterium]
MKHSLPDSPGDPRGAATFVFTACGYDPATGAARLGYRFDDGPELVERITFPQASWPSEAPRQAAFERALELLHGIAGVSYYKAGVSPGMRFENPEVGAALGEFLAQVYIEGLGEFGHVNGLDVAARVHFPAGETGANPPAPQPLLLPERALVAMGGGKDSLVGLDLLRRAGIEVLPACIGGSALIAETVDVAGLPLLRIGRELAPELAAMNRAGAWNGHVPVTAINSAILVCAAILYGCRYVVFSNERSADEATLHAGDGREINHQYSKSSAFESAFRAEVARRVSPSIEYFSVLRPFSELAVVQRFSALTAFHGVYSSCNRNFHLDGPRLEGRWCRDCPKCRFAALSLALFLTPTEVSAILGGDLLDEPGQEEGFRALCQLGRDKPFECVGEAGESRAALVELAAREAWRDHVIVRRLAPEAARVEAPRLETLLQPSARHFIPDAISRRLGLPLAVRPAPAEAEFEGGKVAILGTGREGRAAWRYLRSRHPGLRLDLVDEAAPDPGFAGALSALDRLLTGPLSEAGLERYDILVRSPGISPYRDAIRQAQTAGARLTSPSNLWFAAHRDARTICVTGTKGKSTTSALLAHVLAATGSRVRLAGNIGKPLLDCDDREVDWWVIELSSYQLADLEAQPSVAVILNFSPEHLDWHGSEERYRHDKLRLADLAGDRPIVANGADPLLRRVLSPRQNVRWFNEGGAIRVARGRLLDGDRALELRLPDGLPGAHNLSNTAAVLTVIRALGGELGAAIEAIATFRPLPHRLQLLGESSGLRYVNDSIASTPVATAAALETFAGQTLTLIVGGLDRGIDWTPYMGAFAARTPLAVIGLPDNGQRILAALRAAGVEPARGLHECQDLAAAVELARRVTPRGAIVLLSPGAPSFPHFRDYRDRGCRFAALCGFELEDRDPF